DIEQTEASLKETIQHLHDDEIKVTQLQQSLSELEPQLDGVQQKQEESSAILARAEESMQQWQLRWDEFNHKAAEPRQIAQVEQSKIQHLDQSIQRLGERINRLKQEAESLVADPHDKELQQIEQQSREQE